MQHKGSFRRCRVRWKWDQPERGWRVCTARAKCNLRLPSFIWDQFACCRIVFVGSVNFVFIYFWLSLLAACHCALYWFIVFHWYCFAQLANKLIDWLIDWSIVVCLSLPRTYPRDRNASSSTSPLYASIALKVRLHHRDRNELSWTELHWRGRVIVNQSLMFLSCPKIRLTSVLDHVQFGLQSELKLSLKPS